MSAHQHSSVEPRRQAARMAASRERRSLWIALSLTLGFAAIEAAGGWVAGSLALLSDAGHMITDSAALAIALLAQHVSQRPPSRRASYGYARAEVLAAFINALIMLAVIVWIAVEAVRRLLAPSPVSGGIVVAVAAAGLAVNMVSAWLLSGHHSLNSRAALLHVLGDMLGSVAAVVAGAVIVATGWLPIDPILSLFVSALILRSTWMLLRASTQVLMEGVPAHLSYDDIGRALTRLPGVSAVHDLHVWYMTSNRAALSAHLRVQDAAAWPQTLIAAQSLLAERFGIDHVTLQPTWHQPPTGKRVIPVTPVANNDKPSVH
ncbi:MAG TPA: cation diffusion facilitator family transporter [Casimicrobiaceae bacterium]|nr:cation diffusion facilitator family transporter [Casimicrobiaceae bacterium]